MKTVKNRTLAIITAMLILLATAASAFAVGARNTVTQKVYLPDEYWQQSTGGSEKIFEVGEKITPGTNINTSGVRLTGVASSITSATFQIKLQHKGWFGWNDVGSVYTLNQSTKNKFDPVSQTTVQGEPFSVQWPTTQSGYFRFVLMNPSVTPQQSELTHLIVTAYGSDN